MRNTIILHIQQALLARQAFFFREQDIQLYLFNYLAATGAYDNVFFEYHIPAQLLPDYLWNDVNNVYIDIVVESNNTY
ncbi:hypothetical protein [Polluticoccus soli]|uniref:hypothetical protein n=1 Tax=Polluticoccus soli TaxID=3034150 RepID=UPI0023E24684|nr:hypothetical protein [Flavipsychrobacter sp. JY13-12]